MIFIAINLDDFHNNQNGEPKTTAEMRFINAKGIIEAEKLMQSNYPEHPWALVSKNVFDKNIVTRCVHDEI